MKTGIPLIPILLTALLAPAAARGQAMRGPPGGHNAMAPATQRPDFLQGVGIDQKLDAQISPDLVFRDETGKDVRLGDYFGKRPLVLGLVYYDCPSLCTVVLNEMERTLRGLSLNLGESYDVLTVSFNPADKPALAAAKKASYVKEYGRPGAAAGWHFLTGDPEPIRQLTDTVGFRYKWDDTHKQFVHSSGLIVLTPQGKVSKYFYGIDYAPTDLKLALQEASGNKIGGLAERVVLYCFQYNPTTGKYGLIIGRALKVGGVLTVLGLVGLIVTSSRRDRRPPLAVEGISDESDDGESPSPSPLPEYREREYAEAGDEGDAEQERARSDA